MDYMTYGDMEGSREYLLRCILVEKDTMILSLLDDVSNMIESNPQNAMLGTVYDKLMEVYFIGKKPE